MVVLAVAVVVILHAPSLSTSTPTPPRPTTGIPPADFATAVHRRNKERPPCGERSVLLLSWEIARGDTSVAAPGA